MENLEAISPDRHPRGGSGVRTFLSEGGGPGSPPAPTGGGGGGGSSTSAPPVVLSSALPEAYRADPFAAEPVLEHLRHLDAATATLPQLLQAADADVRLHSARIRAALTHDPDPAAVAVSASTYDPATDPLAVERADRRAHGQAERRRLRDEAEDIVHRLDRGPSRRDMTQGEVLQERLERWGRALELYVWEGGGAGGVGWEEGGGDVGRTAGGAAAAGGTDGTLHATASANANHHAGTAPTTAGGGHPNPNPPPMSIDLLTLLEKLCEHCAGSEEELSEALAQAAQMCTALVEETSLAVRDGTEDAAEAEDAYHIRLEAHAVWARRAVRSAESIEEQFQTNGRAALQIGHQLERAEAKRRQCESAAVLIRRWWTLENLAEQEESSGEEIRVDEEVRGVIPPSAGRMDPLYTQPESSLEAAKALKMLRTVAKQRGGGATTTPTTTTTTATAAGGRTAAGGGLVDRQSIRRFERTGTLVQRVSEALESRLLSSFSGIYTRGGTYDFESPEAAAGRTGRLDWVALRELAEALTYFDNGRSLHKRYVQMVVFSRFPEFIATGKQRNRKPPRSSAAVADGAGGGGAGAGATDDDGDDQDLDMDATRSQLSALFHRVCEVCTAEFQLIAHVFSSSAPSTSVGGGGTYDTSQMDAVPLRVARALLQRVISDPRNGLQARIDDVLATIDRRGGVDAGAKKLDTFVVVHEKAAVLFALLKDAAREHLVPQKHSEGESLAAHQRAVSSLVQFLSTQEIALSEGHRRGYLNLELRMLHHECCANLDNIGARLSQPIRMAADPLISAAGRAGGSGPGVYQAPLVPLDKSGLKKSGLATLLNGPLKQSVLRQPLINATDSLARARLMFGGSQGGTGGDADATARVITAIYSQMCTFYGQAYLFPIIESLGEMLKPSAPSQPPNLPFKEDSPPHELGVDGSFWVGIERIHSAAKAFDRELWAEQRTGSVRVFEILVGTRSNTCLAQAKERRVRFFQELEERGEAAILRALDTLSVHIQWILVAGGESMLATGGSRLLHSVTGKGSGPYAVPTGSALDATNSPAVKSLTYCLRAQFVHTQAALTSESLSAFWTALSMRLYDILVARLLQHYYVSTVGAVILSRDVEALRSVAMLAGRDHSHWDNLRELLTLYMTPPDSLRTMLVGADGDINSGKGLFGRAGRDQALVFMSRRVDYRVKTNQGMKKCQWVVDLLDDLGVYDPTDQPVNIALYSAEQSRKGSSS